MRWKTKDRVIDLNERGLIMGILNATPDSFSDGGRYVAVEVAVSHAIGMLQDGAEIIDIGGESTRPGAPKISEEEELARVIPVIKGLRDVSKCLISIDTSKAAVAKAAIEAGADIVNDVTGLTGDVNMAKVCAESNVGVIVMHMQGTPQTMQDAPKYQDVLRDVRRYFEDRYRMLTKQGVDPQCLCFDPGVGFGKTLEHNLQLLHGLGSLEVWERPILLGVSRKSMIGKILNHEEAEDRDAGTVALTAIGRRAGAQIHRVHEIKRNYEAMRMAEAVLAVEL